MTQAPGCWKTSSDLRPTGAGLQVGSETWLTISHVRELLRCNACKAKGRRTLVQRVEATTYVSDYLAPTTRHRIRFMVGDAIVAYPSPACPECGSTSVRVSVVQGHLVRNKPCDGRCMGATGPRCECSCEGENHGGRYSEWG